MTHRLDVAGGHELVARWCALAEQRLQHLTEMFESGRWRRYYSEVAFLENIREAKLAVETWRGLSTPASIGGCSAVSLSLPAPPRAPRRERIAPDPVALALAPSKPAVADAELVSHEDAPSEEPAIDMLALERALAFPPTRLDVVTIEQRYPLLRNSL
jgi:uncharacterized repeat protein (TIGR03809 family)